MNSNYNLNLHKVVGNWKASGLGFFQTVTNYLESKVPPGKLNQVMSGQFESENPSPIGDWLENPTQFKKMWNCKVINSGL